MAGKIGGMRGKTGGGEMDGKEEQGKWEGEWVVGR